MEKSIDIAVLVGSLRKASLNRMMANVLIAQASSPLLWRSALPTCASVAPGPIPLTSLTRRKPRRRNLRKAMVPC
jgi:hypothetical protein